jgi:hypothetical protein
MNTIKHNINRKDDAMVRKFGQSMEANNLSTCGCKFDFSFERENNVVVSWSMTFGE